jgi:hypothetical protein
MTRTLSTKLQYQGPPTDDNPAAEAQLCLNTIYMYHEQLRADNVHTSYNTRVPAHADTKLPAWPICDALGRHTITALLPDNLLTMTAEAQPGHKHSYSTAPLTNSAMALCKLNCTQCLLGTSPTAS